MRERLHLVVTQLGPDRDVLERLERRLRTRRHDALRGLFAEVGDEAKAEAKREVVSC